MEVIGAEINKIRITEYQTSQRNVAIACYHIGSSFKNYNFNENKMFKIF